jgi:ABC-type polysaccharide/polyol phosphate transport system ATPase subunit
VGQSAISVQNVSKKYRLFNSSKERFLEAFHPFNKKYHREFWALTDINFAVEKGQTIGIIGRNGSGKSTLLQIICSVLRPTSGAVEINGRISALLALGAGFNPEFSGRDNVLLNGALLGFSKAEMKERMPVIESFADIGDFLDQPMKIYSSGMSLRLALAAAINVDPDILVVDEALAVGDAKFQHKCFEKFHEFQNAGKTILLVSHNIDAVVRHCDWAILLENGKIVEKGEPKTVTNRYIDLLFTGKFSEQTLSPEQAAQVINEQNCSPGKAGSELEKFLKDVTITDNCVNRKTYNKNEYRQKQNKAEIIDYLLVCGSQIDPTAVRCGDSVDIYIKAKFNEDVEFPLFGFSVKTVDGMLVYALNSFFTQVSIFPAKKSDVIVGKFSVKMMSAPGDIFIDIGVDEGWSSANSGLISRRCAYNSLDRRCGIIHLFVHDKNWFHGLADFGAEFQEVARYRSSR